ncbi:glutamate-5-semialdehyde dehydrogenase [Saccharomycopsis crataegensis]|uniref:glutamate-5-semialdehyde dehydrogenase n=1 Tax=Saccharomycopsis crataegensis TaxID=43959 RepID=A0AAV5QGM7_9ASCO|nr:glutamate-5-semialdehyde dehydrogenase [Saccharomycopsis crataegensis]
MSTAETIAKNAHIASTILKTLSDSERSQALQEIHDGLKLHKSQIIEANQKDLTNAINNNLDGPLIKRLDLSKGDKFDSMLDGILEVKELEDPIGKITLARELDTNLNLYRVTCPVGVLLVIFESRPEVIANITALAIKSGNAAILKGGKESLETFKVMAQIVNEVIASKTKVPENSIQLISTREEVGALLDQDKFIDLVIPRGSNALVRNIKSNTKIPVMGHADGLCAAYIDDEADLKMACKLVVDAKTNYCAACNAVETLLINEHIAVTDIQTIFQSLFDAEVTLHITTELLDQLEQEFIAKNKKFITTATEEDFHTEFLSFDLAVKSVKDVESAMSHINLHSSKHTDLIITANETKANKFLNGIDSAGVYWNCSTRFADGFRYGFGTEVGISTNKIHARGPVGLEGLVCYQYQLKGTGQIVGDYGNGGRAYIHKDIDIRTLNQ